MVRGSKLRKCHICGKKLVKKPITKMISPKDKETNVTFSVANSNNYNRICIWK